MKVSICIPVYNGEQWLKVLIERLIVQVTDFEYEFIISDSGSMDNSREILREYSMRENFTYIEIPNSEYGHGKTRNILASKATGEYILFTVQDALPETHDWLQNIIIGMDSNPSVDVAFCRHKAWDFSHPVKMRYIQKTFDDYLNEITQYPTFVVNMGVSYYSDTADIENWDMVTAFSNVCAVYRSSIFSKYQFKEIDFAEDKNFAKEILNDGYCIGFYDNDVVFHSHDYTYLETYKRTVDEWVAIKKTGTYEHTFRLYHVLTLSLRSYIQDTRFSLVEARLSIWRKISSIITNFLMELMIKSGMYVGLNYEKLPKWFLKKSSQQEGWREPSIKSE